MDARGLGAFPNGQFRVCPLHFPLFFSSFANRVFPSGPCRCRPRHGKARQVIASHSNAQYPPCPSSTWALSTRVNDSKICVERRVFLRFPGQHILVSVPLKTTIRAKTASNVNKPPTAFFHPRPITAFARRLAASGRCRFSPTPRSFASCELANHSALS
jgi:hypothetical protein